MWLFSPTLQGTAYHSRHTSILFGHSQMNVWLLVQVSSPSSPAAAANLELMLQGWMIANSGWIREHNSAHGSATAFLVYKRVKGSVHTPIGGVPSESFVE